jgi:hypothetical protein
LRGTQGKEPLPEEFRLYELIKITGWTQADIDATPAATCDWLIAIDAEVQQAEAEAEQKRRSAGG